MQADRPAARSRKSTLAHASHDPEGGGTSRSKQIDESRGEGVGRKEKDDEMTQGHEHIIISSPDFPTSSKHRITHQPPPHILHTSKEPARRHPVAIASRDKQPPPSYHIGAVPVPAAISSHPRQQDGKDDRGTADKSWPWHHIQSTIRSRRWHDPIKASKQPHRLPVPRHEERGDEARR